MSAGTDRFEFLSALGDDRLILGHRLSEWCGHAPILEEDIALANIALDLIGQSVFLLEKAGETETRKRSADDLAYLRDPGEFRNLLIVEQQNGDFARTLVRQFLFDAYSVPLWETLATSADPIITAVAAKAVKEDRYHLSHSREWILRLGDGTEESAARTQKAVNELWIFTHEMFESPPFIQSLVASAAIPDLGGIKATWEKEVSATFALAKLTIPAVAEPRSGGRSGRHSEALTSLLSEMQVLQRTYPGAAW